ncbi:hypothetical protein MmarC5_0249 [Methanococcus maripaludis C5]|uniref:Uncharacterized protein n=1 Tax=Methanococcus maripaludis (strain C5 / ATCC BAA-1333) TaxID=402880 RepID=A4FWJ0_METM5|nr:hypothetical protein [Methanococcus maripaludis]ABO34565.1 hypothetical protein MmarC5_0249 [Methanococcus maripaludis C5]
MDIEVYSHIKNGILIFEIEIPANDRLTNPKMIMEAVSVLKRFAEEKREKMFF